MVFKSEERRKNPKKIKENYNSRKEENAEESKNTFKKLF